MLASVSLREAAHEVHRGSDVGPVEHGFADIAEADTVEAGALEDAGGGGAVAEGERLHRRRHRLGRAVESGADGHCPLVALAALPDEQHQAPADAQCTRDVAEGGHGVGEEHRAEPADGEVVVAGGEGVHLGVAVLVCHVVELLGDGEPAGVLEHRRGDVDAEHAPGRRGAGGVARRLPGAAADVENVVTGGDAGSGAKSLVVSAELGVVVDHDAAARCRAPARISASPSGHSER